MDIPDPAPFHLRQSRRDGAIVLALEGEVDAGGAPALRESLVDAIENVGGLVVVDLSQVPYVDSVGLGTLVGALKRANERGVTLRFVVTGSQILKVLNITGLIRVFDLYASAEDAIRGRVEA